MKGLVAIIFVGLLGASVASAEVLCVKNSTKSSKVKNSRVSINLGGQLATSPTTCPAGFKQVADLGQASGLSLLSGQTLTGIFNLSGGNGEGYAADSISFSKPIVAPPTVEVVKPGLTSSTCTGSVSNPTAPAGRLCIYQAYQSNISSIGTYDPTSINFNSASKYGAALYGYASGAGNFFTWGTWAVSAF